MEGIHFVTNAKGKKVAVQIDLERYGSLWEDFCDQLIVEERRGDRLARFHECATLPRNALKSSFTSELGRWVRQATGEPVKVKLIGA